MSHKSLLVVLLVVALLAVLIAPAAAQDGMTALATGLVNPRGITFDAGGSLYIVEAGNGGDLEALGPFGPAPHGATGQVTRVNSEGSQEVILFGLPSMDRDNTRGAQDIVVTEDAIWLLIGETSLNFALSHTLLELDKETLRIRRAIDLYTLEATENPDGDIVSSNPTGFAVGADGAIYIANAGCNCVQQWTEADGLSVFTAWSIDENPVPTAVDVGPDGNVYVGFLTGFPFPQGGSRVDVFSPDGELVTSYGGLTSVVDLLVTDDGTIYAVEFGVFGDQGWAPGRLVTVSAEGITAVMEDLPGAWGIAMSPDGSLAVGYNAAGGGDGMVVAVEMGM